MDVMIGIDPHEGSHTAVVVNLEEVVIDQTRVKATAGQLVELHEWASGHLDRRWAVESARGMGYLISQQLVAAGEQVIDVPAMMAARVRVRALKRRISDVSTGTSSPTSDTTSLETDVGPGGHPGTTLNPA